MSTPFPAQAAFDAYLCRRHRMPRARFPESYQVATTLAEIVAPFDLVLFDSYGVLNVGEAPVPGAAQAIAALRANDKSVMVVSNSAGYPKRVMMARYRTLGFDFSDREVVTSREALLHRLKDEPARHWGLMLNNAYGTKELEELAISFLAEDAAAYDRVEGFLLVGSDGWTDQRQNLLESSLRNDPRPVLVGNPDIVAPREVGLSREPGDYAHRLADATGIEPEFLGKPFCSVFDLALSRLASPPPRSRVLMVGDTLHTDILGGAQMGFQTALVTDHGSLVGPDPAEAIRRAGIVPDFVINRI